MEQNYALQFPVLQMLMAPTMELTTSIHFTGGALIGASFLIGGLKIVGYTKMTVPNASNMITATIAMFLCDHLINPRFISLVDSFGDRARSISGIDVIGIALAFFLMSRQAHPS